MTRETLEGAIDLKNYIGELEDKLERARARAISTVTSLSTVPGSSAVSDKVGNNAMEIAYLKYELMLKRMEYRHISKWINGIEDHATRKIFARKYLYGDSMRRIARDFGFDRRELKAFIEQALSSLLQEVRI